jgi:hypothetical protein
MEASFFSDSFVLSSPENRDDLLIRETGHLCRELLLKGFASRGAITTGQLYHRAGLVFGLAFIRAVEMEKRIAIYPRVILDKQTLDTWKNTNPTGTSSWIKRDRDGQHFVNIFDKEWDDRTSYDRVLDPTQSIFSDGRFMDKAREAVDEGLRATEFSNASNAKWQWLANQYQDECVIIPDH